MLLIYVLIPSPSVPALLLLFCRGVGAVRVFVCVCERVCARGVSRVRPDTIFNCYLL